ncbi:serine hydrolase domain-containing protein [Paenibacillus alkalitolerans]|uniref:serine hydrolase domain-containing protein n=1 Tax=Paenibacillus alkalitolerans TaxID=2799335 RepID=UPI0018F2C232|nr:serine hydrolase domain-containing protein [Paenibacillus alkalitolerans]
MISKEKLESVFGKLEQEHYLSGTILVAQSGEVLFEKAYGKASMQLNVSNSLDTKFQIASLTKMFIAMSALIIYEEGLIDLHEKPGKYMPEMSRLDENITIHHLLSHSSGLHDVYEVPDVRFEMSKLKRENGDFLSYLINQQQLFIPGQKWSYSSTGYILTGYILEKVTGLSFADILEQYILTPLNMKSSGVDNPRKVNPGRAYGHTTENGVFINTDNDKLSEIDAPGELYSTVRDLKKWCDALFEYPLISPAALKLMFTPHARVGDKLNYGYGWFLTDNSRMHGGGTPGFRSEIKQYPGQEASVIMLFNYERADVSKLLGAIEPVILG